MLLVAAVVFLIYNNKPTSIKNDTSKTAGTTQNPGELNSPEEEYIFVPYWTISSDLADAPYDNLIYFGISADLEGIDKTDLGYKNMSEFIANTQGKETHLTVRMLDSDVNLEILDNKNLQEKVISQSIDIARENGFTGIILDLEIQGIPFESFVQSITDLNINFSKSARNNNLTFGTLIYGDAYFRARPYSVKEIAQNVDRVYVMAYDFSKARGNPGPNFPLSSKEVYGYDFKTMTVDYLKDVSAEKLTVVLGMFGYDWEIDNENRGIGIASSKSTLGFEKFMISCVDSNSCSVSVDPDSKETQIIHTQENKKHIVWFETSSSADRKIEFLKSSGVNSIGFWAYSFF